MSRTRAKIVAVLLVMMISCTAWAATNTAVAPEGRYRIVEAEAVYHVDETFASIGFNTAIGRTKTITFEAPLVLNAVKGLLIPTVRVDARTLKSDSQRRDGIVNDLITNHRRERYATLYPTTVEGSPTFAVGKEETFQLKGKMWIRGVENPVVFQVKSLYDGQKLHAMATRKFKMTDFGMSPPNVLGFVKVEDEVKLEVRITAEPVQGE